MTVTPPGDTRSMSTQLRLIDGGARPTWRLDARTRRIGRRGVAEARRALRRARRPEPPQPLREAG